MHCVYKITFTERELREIYPCYYIGSKSNYTINENGNLVGRKRGAKEYWGSSDDKLFKSLIKNDTTKTISIIKSFEDYSDCLEYERNIQLELDVVANKEYFNKSIAMENNYTNPEYATYKNIHTGKCVRLPRNHILVLNGEYVGVSKDSIQSEETKHKKKRFVKDNHFFGKNHSDETNDKISARVKEAYKNKPELRQRCSDWMTKLSRGVPKSEEHKKKIGRKGMVTIKNMMTGEVKRLYKESEEYSNRDNSIWKTPYAISCINGTVPKVKCEYCGKMLNKTHHTRWHGDNCKQKPIKSNINNIIE